MRRFISCTLCLIMMLLSCAGCTAPAAATTAAPGTAGQTSTTTLAAQSTTPATVATTAAATTKATTAAATTKATTAATTAADINKPVNTAAMYTSYALMVSFDPARGWADFDYFDMLRGDDAVKWLMENKGYTKAAAQAEVDGYSDSEYIMKNVNPQLRTIDLRNVPILLMYHADGSALATAEPIYSSLDDLYKLYANHPDLVLDSYFYHVIVANGEVTSVEQVYWP